MYEITEEQLDSINEMLEEGLREIVLASGRDAPAIFARLEGLLAIIRTEGRREPVTEQAQEIRHLHKQLDDRKDSIEIGTPGKAGAIKVYGDAGDPAEFARRMGNMVELRKQLNEMIAKEAQV